MVSFFMDGPDMVRWELTQTDASGDCRLAVHHPRGTIVEYFKTPATALLRVQELENMLHAVRAASLSAPAGMPS